VPSLDAWYVARTMRALELLAFQPLSAPQLAAALEVHPRTARRLLTRLHDEGYLTISGDARRLYSPSMRVVALAGQIVANSPLTRRALPYVARLHEQSGAAAHLSVPSYQSTLCVVHDEGGHDPVRPQPRELVPSHCTATGKALLGWRDRWRDNILDRPLEHHTKRTVVDPAALRREVAAARERGYAVEVGEFEEGISGVAAPVFVGGEAVAALGVSGPGVDVEALAGRVVAFARELTESLEDPRG
jgi:DNA-binding IclR family transcriptional regulator